MATNLRFLKRVTLFSWPKYCRCIVAVVVAVTVVVVFVVVKLKYADSSCRFPWP